MSTKDECRKLEKEIQFWERVYEYDAPSKYELDLGKKLIALRNADSFGNPQYNGHYEEDDEDDNYEYTPRVIRCKYCGKSGLQWTQVQGRWRLAEQGTLHVCDEYKTQTFESMK